jgi:phosphoribosylformylglycinamidine synthase
MQAAILLFPGTNRERDMAQALTRAGIRNRILFHTERDLPPGTDLVVMAGGFSYGDYLRCGAMAARSPVMDAVRAHAARGGLILGVCNGFQILTEAGLLPGALLRNATLRFLSMDCHLRVETADSPFTRRWSKGAVVRAPMAHGDGNYFCDDETLAVLRAEDRIAFRYTTADGALTEAANRNGSRDAIAGILSANRRILGLMPHPEDMTDPLQGGTDGLPMFLSLADALASA